MSRPVAVVHALHQKLHVPDCDTDDLKKENSASRADLSHCFHGVVVFSSIGVCRFAGNADGLGKLSRVIGACMNQDESH